MVINMWALIQNGTVAEITDIDPAGRFHPDLVWVECGSNVKNGWLYDGVKFSSPEPEATSIPQSCTPAQGLVALFALKNITENDINSAIEGISDHIEKYTAQIAFKRSVTWERQSASIQTMASLLSLSEKDLDDLFAYAVTVQV